MFKNDEMSFGAWIVAFLIMMIPLVNIVMMFVFAFGNYNKTFSNFFKAQLVMAAVGIVLWVTVVGSVVTSLMMG